MCIISRIPRYAAVTLRIGEAMAKRRKVHRNDTNAITMLTVFALGFLIVIANERQLGLSPAAVDTLGDLFSGLLSVAAMSLTHYSCRG